MSTHPRHLTGCQARSTGRLLLALACLAGPLAAHEDNSVEIANLTAAIAANPADPQLYLKRAEMQRLLQHWEAAEADYSQAAKLAPDLAIVDLASASMWNDAGKPKLALPLLDRFIQRSPDNPGGFSERGRARRLDGQFRAAADDYARAVALTREPAPEDYASWAAALVDAGAPAEAVAVLNQGIGRLGRLPALDFQALDIEQQSAQFDAALARLEILLAAPGRKDSLLVRKAEILLAAGHRDAAKLALAQAQAELDSLPDMRRLTAASQKVAASIQRIAAALAAATTPTNQPSQ